MLKSFDKNVIGLIPAAGLAKRLSPIPCSKEIFPVGFDQNNQPKTAIQYLLDRFAFSGIKDIHIVLRNGKWDIPRYLGDGSEHMVNISYLIMKHPFGVPFTLDQAYPFIKNKIVAFGLPDIILQPVSVFNDLLSQLIKSNSDVVLGIYKASNPQKMDLVEFDSNNRVREIYIKPRQSRLQHSWMTAVWTPRFTDFLHKTVAAKLEYFSDNFKTELNLGEVFNLALSNNIAIDHILFENYFYRDIGSPEDLIEVIKMNL
ncbi:MAG: dTDP-glucose pyrophosphorylase [Candidatus Lokiarchaeota archaeon]|nr:dTDP-glucose pyrophosphorylase [Candidatus Lokiarchaeota archaeon]